MTEMDRLTAALESINNVKVVTMEIDQTVAQRKRFRWAVKNLPETALYTIRCEGMGEHYVFNVVGQLIGFVRSGTAGPYFVTHQRSEAELPPQQTCIVLPFAKKLKSNTKED